jgi:hypothetical protein
MLRAALVFSVFFAVAVCVLFLPRWPGFIVFSRGGLCPVRACCSPHFTPFWMPMAQVRGVGKATSVFCCGTIILRDRLDNSVVPGAELRDTTCGLCSTVSQPHPLPFLRHFVPAKFSTESYCSHAIADIVSPHPACIPIVHHPLTRPLVASALLVTINPPPPPSSPPPPPLPPSLSIPCK